MDTDTCPGRTPDGLRHAAAAFQFTVQLQFELPEFFEQFIKQLLEQFVEQFIKQFFEQLVEQFVE